jgi:hypothetical protein
MKNKPVIEVFKLIFNTPDRAAERSLVVEHDGIAIDDGQAS